MRSGYRVNWIFGPESDELSDLPQNIFDDEDLEQQLDSIKEAIRSWIKRPRPESEVLSLGLMGPMSHPSDWPSQTPWEKWKAIRGRLAMMTTRRNSILGTAAKMGFDLGEFDEARAYASELESMRPHLEEDPESHGQELADLHVVQGRFALQDGNTAEAVQRLLAAGAAAGSPVRESFGPNMSLAEDLLKVGEKDAVLAYFEACRAFWDSEFSQLDAWTADVLAGRMPDFGANLVY